MICKIWGIKARIKKGETPTPASIMKGVADTENYVKDEEKINGILPPTETFDGKALEREIDYMNELETFQDVINYMKNEHKTKKTFVSGYMCDPEFLIEQFTNTKLENLKRVGETLEDDLTNQAFHIVQSFPDDLDISDEEVHQCGLELCKKLGIHQALVTSHLHPVYDENGVEHGKCKHNHIMINSHINPEFVDPEHPERMKYHDCKETYAQLREWNDEIAIEHGFPVILNPENEKTYTWYANQMENEGKSWMQRVRYDMESAMRLSSSWEEYEKAMQASHYKIRLGKHETYTTPEGQKVRGSTLGNEYTRKYLEEYWQLKKEINTILKESEEEQQQTVTYTNLKALLQKFPHELSVNIPRINKNTKQPYTFSYPLTFEQKPEVTQNYIQENAIYPLYRDKKEQIGFISGKDILDVMLQREHETYEEQKTWEEEETKRQEQDEIKKILKRNQEEMDYQRENWNNSKTKHPYRVGLYDENGHRRSLIEHILILAIVVIHNEVPDFVIPEKQRKEIEKKNETLTLIIAKPSWKMERLMEALKYAKEEQITDFSDLKQKLNLAGKEYQKVKAAQNKNESVRRKMKPIQKALQTYEYLKETCEAIFSMPEGEQKNTALLEKKEEINKYNAAKATLHHYNIFENNKIQDFKSRWEYNTNEKERLTKETKRTAEHYRKLKKVSYQVELALNKNYCYGDSPELDKFKKPINKEKQKEQNQKTYDSKTK